MNYPHEVNVTPHRLIPIVGLLACAQTQPTLVRVGTICPTLNPQTVDPSALWITAEPELCGVLDVTLTGDDTLRDALWITADSEAQEAVSFPDVSEWTITQSETLQIEICPTEAPLSGTLRFRFTSGCVASLYITEED